MLFLAIWFSKSSSDTVELDKLTKPKFAISQLEANSTALISYDIKSLTWYPTISWSLSSEVMLPYDKLQRGLTNKQTTGNLRFSWCFTVEQRHKKRSRQNWTGRRSPTASTSTKTFRLKMPVRVLQRKDLHIFYYHDLSLCSPYKTQRKIIFHSSLFAPFVSVCWQRIILFAGHMV